MAILICKMILNSEVNVPQMENSYEHFGLWPKLRLFFPAKQMRTRRQHSLQVYRLTAENLFYVVKIPFKVLNMVPHTK